MMFVCRQIGEHLFESYYAMEWGVSARIMHSPPLGTNYTEKLAIVEKWPLVIGFIVGGLLGVLLSYKWLAKLAKGCEKQPSDV